MVIRKADYNMQKMKQDLSFMKRLEKIRKIASGNSAAKAKKHYRHESLCGIFNSDATEEQLIEDYLQEKYNL